MNDIFELEVANADFVTDFLAVGGDLDYDTRKAVEQAVELVDSALITHVLDVRLEEQESLWERFPEVAYHWDGIDDADGAATAAWFERATDWAVQAIEAGGTVLAHCHMGINRGPSAGYAILLRLGWDPVQALDAIRNARPIAYVAFAEHALEWHLARAGASSADKARARRRVAEWRERHPLDVVRVIRAQRARQTGSAA